MRCQNRLRAPNACTASRGSNFRIHPRDVARNLCSLLRHLLFPGYISCCVYVLLSLLFMSLCCVLLSRLLNHISYVLMTLLMFCIIFFSSRLYLVLYNYYSFLGSPFFIIFSYPSVFSSYRVCVFILLFFCPSLIIFSFLFSFLLVNFFLVIFRLSLFFLLTSYFFPQIFHYLLCPEERGTRLLRNIGICVINCIVFLPTRQS